MSIRRTVTIGVGLGLLVVGCSRPQPATVTTEAQVSPSSPIRYPLVGTVREVQRDPDRVMIRHEAIPGFMTAMTMPFPLDDEELLDELHAGDEVEGILEVERQGKSVRSYRLVDLRVTRPALSQAPAPRPTLLEPGQEVPDFAVTTQQGQELRLSELRGQCVVMTFIYTRCPLPDFCPLMDRKFSELAQRLRLARELDGRVRLLSISFDPSYDTPEVLMRHAASQGAQLPLWTYAVASHEELARVAPGLGMTYAPGDREILHNLVTAVIDPAGRLLWLRTGRSWDSSEILRVLRAAPSSRGHVR